LRLASCLGLLLATLPGALAAQLDLPKKPAQAPRNPAETLLPPTPPKGDLAPKDGVLPLDLPSGHEAPAASPATPAASEPEEAARALFRELAAVREVERSTPLFERLLALGPAVVPVARAALEGDHGPTLLVAGRLCLIGGTSADRAAVAQRLTRALPAEAAALLAELVARDPMLSPPEYLAGLLEHPSPAVRNAALAQLGAHAGGVPLSALAPLCASPRTATRTAAVELVARSEDPLAWNLLASRLGDTSAQLARRAADLLAAIDGAEPLVLERAFPVELRPGPLSWDRARAYALLSVVQREESTQRVLLREAHIESLRDGLHSSLPLVAGACAVGLARVGFRIGPSRAGAWLDREVPHVLVRCGTAAEFHNDFSSLERPALRALGLLTGETFGADGEAWRRWWLDNAESFRARHAVIELGPQAAGELLVAFPDERAGTWCLLGPERAPSAGSARVLRLDQAAAERLLSRLESEGIFGIERFPDSARARAACALRVAVGEQEKCFARGVVPGGGASWLDGLLGELLQVVEENRWQLYFDPRATNADQWWRSEHERWAVLAPLERQRALAQLLIEVAGRLQDAEREPCLIELERLYQDAAVPLAADFEPLLALLAGETTFGPRAERLCELARVAAGCALSAARDSTARERLLTLVLERFGPEADAVLARVARDLTADTLRALARDPRPRARALAAYGLLRCNDAPDGLELVRALCADAVPSVQLAAFAALAGIPAERAGELRPLLLERARSGQPELRLAALRVLGQWGGKDVHDLALEAIADADESVQIAGVEALAELADPRSASLLASLLARGPGSPLFSGARRGLARMGPAGIEECSRLAHSGNLRARREAALLLAEALAPEAAALLLPLLLENPADQRVAWELSVLAGLDFVDQERPDQAATAWWNLVVHDDPLAWCLAAAERAGVPAPPRTALEGELSPAGARFLLALADLPAPELVERAVRELERRLAVEIHRPASTAEREAFQKELREAVRARLGE
jgi:HEAT repeat protein